MLYWKNGAVDFAAEEDVFLLEQWLIFFGNKLALIGDLESLDRPNLINPIPGIIITDNSIVLIVDQIHG